MIAAHSQIDLPSQKQKHIVSGSYINVHSFCGELCVLPSGHAWHWPHKPVTEELRKRPGSEDIERNSRYVIEGVCVQCDTCSTVT